MCVCQHLKKATISLWSELINHLDDDAEEMLTNKRTVVLTCDILVHFEMLACESKPDQEENAKVPVSEQNK